MQASISKFMRYFEDFGVDYTADYRSARYLRIINRMSLFIGLYDFLIAIIFYLNGYNKVGDVIMICGVCFIVITPYLNKVGFIRFSRFAFAFFGTAVMVIISLLIGPDSEPQVILLVAACSPFCTISPRDYKLWIPTVMLPVIGFFFLEIYDYQILPPEMTYDLGDQTFLVKIVWWVFTFLFLCFVTFFFTTQELNFEKRLNETINKMESEIKVRIAAEEELVTTKSRIETINNILTHDLANSITSSIFFLKKVGKKLKEVEHPTIEENLNYIERLQNNQENIRNSIKTVLQMRSIDSKKEEMTLSPVLVLNAIETAKSLFTEQLEKKNIFLDMRYNEDMKQVCVNANETILINQVIANFLSNCIKFSDVDSSIELECLMANQREVIITIQDHGIGMPEDIRSSLFILNSSVSRKGTSGEKGIGFGMPMAQHFIEMMGGQLTVTSVCRSEDPVNCGTCFRIALQRAS